MLSKAISIIVKRHALLAILGLSLISRNAFCQKEALRSEIERLEYLVRIVPDYIVQRERMALAKRVAPLNGHPKVEL